MANDGCIHTKILTISLPRGGDIIYGVAHQHGGGVGSTLYGEVSNKSSLLGNDIVFSMY